MSLFDLFFGPRGSKIDDPNDLKEALFQAIARRDGKSLVRICQTNKQAVLDHFPDWQRVPENLRSDPAAMQSYVHSLVNIAEVFAERMSCPDLLSRLTGNDDSNPLARWQNRLEQARNLMAELNYQKARELLTDLLIDCRDLQGSGADLYRPVTLGFLGECYFQNREADNAIPHLQQALHLCEQNGDRDGILAYLGNLYEVYRYLGQADTAAGYADRLAAAMTELGRTTEAHRYRRQAEIVRAGEPLNRVVAVVEGVRRELDEVTVETGMRVELIFERNRPTLRPTSELTRLGQELGSQGRLDEALANFRDAAKADPYDPNARYQEAYTLLQLQRYHEAVESYEATETLAPGWFHCRADLWLASELALGRLSYDTGAAILVLADSPLPPKKKLHLAEQILIRAPHMAHGHLILGKQLALLGRMRDAQAAYRQGLGCAPEPDVETRLLVELAILCDVELEKAVLLRKAQSLRGNLIAAAQAALILKSLAASA